MSGEEIVLGYPAWTVSDKALWRRDESLGWLHDTLVRERDKLRLISFDFFDTLVLRMAAEPVNVFIEVGRRLAEAGLLKLPVTPHEFMKLREIGERNARKAATKIGEASEVTLAQIYAQMGQVVSDPVRAAAIEVQTEQDWCCLNPSMWSLLCDAKARGYRVAVVSDTYFSAEDLRGILRVNGADPGIIDLVLASSEHGFGKWNSGLFRLALAELNLQPEQVLHIGDNDVSDYRNPTQLGMRALCYYRVTPYTHEVFHRERQVSMPRQETTASANALRVLAQRLMVGEGGAEGYFRDGAFLLGPVLTGYADWCVQQFQARGVTRVLAFMREGMLLAELIRRAAQAQGVSLEVMPYYTSRQATNLASLGEATLENLLPRMARRTTPKVKDVLKGFGLTREEMTLDDALLDRRMDSQVRQSVLEFLGREEVRATIEGHSAARRDAAMAYTRPFIGDAEKIGIVDLGWGGTIQANLVRILRLAGCNAQVIGCYLATGSRACELVLDGSEVHAYLGNLGAGDDLLGPLFRSPEFLEQAVNACTGSTLGYALQDDGSAIPVQEDYNVDPWEVERRQRLQAGLFAYQDLWLAIRTHKSKQMDAAACRVLIDDLDWQARVILARLVSYPTQPEAQRLGSLNHDDNLGSDSWRQICDPQDAQQLAREGIATLMQNPDVYWPQGVVAQARPDVIRRLVRGWSDPVSLGMLGSRSLYAGEPVMRSSEELRFVSAMFDHLQPEQVIVFGWSDAGSRRWLQDTVAALPGQGAAQPGQLRLVHVVEEAAASLSHPQEGMLQIAVEACTSDAGEAVWRKATQGRRTLLIIDSHLPGHVMRALLETSGARLGPESLVLVGMGAGELFFMNPADHPAAICGDYTQRMRGDAAMQVAWEKDWSPAGHKLFCVLRKPSVYAAWIERHALTERRARKMQEAVARWPQRPFIHLLLAMGGDELPLLADTLEALGTQIYSDWRLTVLTDIPAPEGLDQATAMLNWVTLDDPQQVLETANTLVAEVGADWVALLDPGDRLPAHALYTCAEHMLLHPEWHFVYVDEDRIDAAGRRHDPRFKPDLNLELLRSMPYVGNFCLTRRATLLELGGFAPLPGMESYDLAFRVLDAHGEPSIGHVSDVLYHRRSDRDQTADPVQLRELGRIALLQHLERNAVTAVVSDGLVAESYFVEYQHAETPRVSIIIPTRDRLDLLQPCLLTLLAKTQYPDFEVLVVDNASTDPATLQFLDEVQQGDARVRVLRYPHEYNYAAINNMAAREAQGDYLLLLNNDTLIVQDQWLDRLMAYAQRPEVGIVGARLVFKNQRIQHAGIILGMGVNGVAEHPGLGLPMSEPGYLQRLQMVQNCAAVTGACLLVSKEIYEHVGGLDESLRVLYNDVDFCLKVGALGRKVLWTPFSTVVHFGSGSLRQDNDPKRLERARREVATMFERWLPQLAQDPNHNRNLSLIHNDWRPDVELAFAGDPVMHDVPRIAGMGFGSQGSWQFRGMQPLAALGEVGLAEELMLPWHTDRVRVPTVAELERIKPDVLLMHNTVHDLHLSAMERYRRFNKPFMVFGQDDLMHAIPPSNPFHRTVYPDIKQRIRKALSMCDRLLVTTEPLAEAWKGMIDDVRVLPNYLDGDRWGTLKSLRRQGRKPRVGWAGAPQHGGDLALLLEVVQATANEVEWVFFGMCLDEFKPYVAELHGAVAFEAYPAKLAMLNLDLALAPLEHNKFNEAKSNLRVLEYGALGWPVIGSDIAPYRDTPVTRVPNNPRAWINAIREHVHDLDAAAVRGDALRQWVLDNWLLQNHLDEWLAALVPGARTVADAPSRQQRITA